MTKPASKGDIHILSAIATYNFLTVKQLCVLQQRSIQVIRRRLRYLKNNEYISIIERVFGPGPGRNEHIAILSIKGVNLLKSEKILNGQTKSGNIHVHDLKLVEHDLLLNWFLIHLIWLERSQKRFEISTVTSRQKNFFYNDSNQLIGIDPLPVNEINDVDQEIIPDGVFTITDRPSKKSLLFFLEVDRGTESLTINAQNPKNIEQKINGYKTMFRTGAYKRYDKISKSSLNGFRLLFLTDTISGMNKICRFTSAVQPSDFIWVTEQKEMFQKGLGAEIWWRGGKTTKDPESILSKKSAFMSRITIK